MLNVGTVGCAPSVCNGERVDFGQPEEARARSRADGAVEC
jgi:hypothetical protein